MIAEYVIAGGALMLERISTPVFVKSNVAEPVGEIVMARERRVPLSIWSVALRCEPSFVRVVRR